MKQSLSKLKKVGKIGKANIEARRLISEKAEELNLNRCEIGFKECLFWMFLAPAHRHKRAWYRGDVQKLADYKQWVAACTPCHNRIEIDPKLTEEVFMRLRGKE